MGEKRARIGSYDISDHGVGTRGGAAVHRARSRATGQRVTLYELRGERAFRLDKQAALLRSLLRFEKLQIERYVDHFEEAGVGYLVTEYIEGRALDALDLRLTPREIERMIVEVGDTLARLHALGPPVLHRDVGPANIVRRDDGRFFLVGFAVAAGHAERVSPDSLVVASIDHLAPEAERGELHRASDVYGLAATAVRVALGGARGEALVDDDLKARVGELPLSPRFRGALAAMLEADPRQRAKSVAEALDRAVDVEEQAERAGVRRGSIRTLLGWVAALVGLVGLVAWCQPDPADRAASVPPSASPPASTSAPSTASSAAPKATGQAALSPCDTYVATWSKGAALGGVAPDPVAPADALSARVLARKLDAADLARPSSDWPCSSTPGAIRAYVGAARESHVAWRALGALDPDLLRELRTAVLSPESKRGLGERADEIAEAALRPASDTAALERAERLCGFATELDAPTKRCAHVAAERTRRGEREGHRATHCDKLSQAAAACRHDCLMRLDLFDLRMDACESACDARFSSPDCDTP